MDQDAPSAAQNELAKIADDPILSSFGPEASAVLGVENSLSGRRWVHRARAEETAKEFQNAGLSVPLANVLAGRGVTGSTLKDFLEPTLKRHLPDPSLLANMDIAAERIADAIQRGETIAILGDYDVDGACSSALLIDYFRRLGREAILYIPDRITEGYGPSVPAMSHLAEQGTALIVTVDCGAAAVDALARAKALGMDVVVLDHHAVESDPPAFAHVNPNGPSDTSGLKYLCAAAVTFLAMVAVSRVLRLRGWFVETGTAEPDLLEALDLVGLATVTDVVPLIGVNRLLVRQGLRKLAALERVGLRALGEAAKASPPFGVYHLGFVFGPRINAGGRVGRCDLGAQLLSCTDIARAREMAGDLDLHNRERQAIEQIILEEAIESAARQDADPFIFLTGEGWHPGVVGIVASRLKDRFEKPVLIAGFMSSKDDEARGSARSMPGIDIGAIIRAAKEAGHLSAGGGHAMAAGFALQRSQVGPFTEYLRTSFGLAYNDVIAARTIEVDSAISLSAASIDLTNELESAGPFGAGHPEPVFAFPDVEVAYADIVGNGHVRLRLRDANGVRADAIAFRAADTPLGMELLRARDHRFHIAGKIRRDDFNGRSRVQIFLDDAARVSL